MRRIAWFRASPPDSSALLDETAPIVAALRRTHDIDVVTAGQAHDFVWKHFRHPYDVCVYEAGSTPAHAFMRAYLQHYPGIIAPRGLGVELGPESGPGPDPGFDHATLTVGVLDERRLDLVERVVQRTCEAGAPVRVLRDSNPRRILRDADVIVALEWPPLEGTPTAALLGLAARKPVIVLEVESTADWPALDPQTWQRRGFSPEPPIVVSLDPRDEQHSLMLALKRLAADHVLRGALATAGHAWWRTHATLDHAVRAWESMLASGEAVRAPTRAPEDHRVAACTVLADFGVTVDFLDS
jgi:hypothetical protein